MLTSRTFLIVPAMLAFACAAAAQGDTNAKAPEPDNSGVNKTVVDSKQPTADNQSNAKADVELAAKVRKALVADKTLSTYAHNVKVLAKNGMVAVSGPVKTDAERQAVAALATGVAGEGKVDATGVVAKN